MTMLKWLFLSVIFVSSSGKQFYKNVKLRQDSVITNQGNVLFNEEVQSKSRSEREIAFSVDQDSSMVSLSADAPDDSGPSPAEEDASELPTCLLCVCLTGSVYCEEVVPDLTAVPTLPKETAYLYARYNKIKKITAKNFADIVTLKRIDLTGNMISEIEDGAFSKLTMLEELSLAENRLVKLPMLPTKLTSFNANHNQLSTKGVKATAFKKLTNLVNLFLAHNSLEAVPNIPESVRVVHLQNNNITTVSDDSFCKGNDTYYLRTNLNEVRMDGNPVVLAKYPNSFTCLKALPIGKYH